MPRRYVIALLLVLAAAAPAPQHLPSGAYLTPLAAPGAQFQPLNPHLAAFPDYTVGQAINMALSPDRKTLVILTSGYNILYDGKGKRIPSASNEYVFIEDVSAGPPVQTQALPIPNSYVGLAFAPSGTIFYASGGVDDDVHVFARHAKKWVESQAPIALGHLKNIDPNSEINNGGSGLGLPPAVAGLAVTANGSRLLAANFENDSITLVALATGKLTEIPLRPGDINPRDRGRPGGEYPFGIAMRGNDTAYVSSLRDREIDVITLKGAPHLTARIPVHGNPESLILNKSGRLLFVACDNSDDVEIIDTALNRVVASVRTIAPAPMLADAPHYRGVGPNNLTLSPDEHTLYVTNGGTNNLAVIALAPRPHVTGLIPTGYFPNAAAATGGYIYVVNGKSIPGPNPGNCTGDPAAHILRADCSARNQYILQLSKAGFLSFPVPAPAELAQTTAIAAHDEHFDEMPSAADAAVMAALHQRIHHIIYILRENRTYDEELGDLGEGNGDPALAEFGRAITPNAHEMASDFVDLDNFQDSGEVSGNGWPWSTTARESDIGAKTMPIYYAERGLSYDVEGTNRDIDIAIPTLAGREAEDPLIAQIPDIANILPGENDVAAPDGPGGEFQRGYLWDAAIRAGLTVRNYGFYLDLGRYFLPPKDGGIPASLTNPYVARELVAFPANPVLAPRTDRYFRGFDNAFPDFYREAEWQREFNLYVKNNNLPNLTLLRLMHDHLGSFKTAIDGVNTPETQMADNDYAVAAVIAAVAHSQYASSTLIFVVEDDAQDGPDHVDAHRSVAYIVGPYVKHHAVISTAYSTVNFLRTMEDILGTGHLSINDAFQRPMADVFDLTQSSWNFTPIIPAPLSATKLPLPKTSQVWTSTHPASWWAAETAGYDWTQEDRIPAVKFNMLLWAGLHDRVPYPARPGMPPAAPDVDDD